VRVQAGAIARPAWIGRINWTAGGSRTILLAHPGIAGGWSKE
jgi:hypothetical protein